MTEDMKQVIHEMEHIAKSSFNRVKDHLMSNAKMPLSEYGMMLDIAKDSSEMMKNVCKIKNYYMEHNDTNI